MSPLPRRGDVTCIRYWRIRDEKNAYSVLVRLKADSFGRGGHLLLSVTGRSQRDYHLVSHRQPSSLQTIHRVPERYIVTRLSFPNSTFELSPKHVTFISLKWDAPRILAILQRDMVETTSSEGQKNTQPGTHTTPNSRPLIVWSFGLLSIRQFHPELQTITPGQINSFQFAFLRNLGPHVVQPPSTDVPIAELVPSIAVLAVTSNASKNGNIPV
ncbi:hypothetical protein BLNAU_6664 [Blattamonas nauphoetae]|uniref:Uncharacterized protein n=1 Tax=Blattamonas nauphoetae TaxID=2049346 RepID=A0ABQ9Y3V5_9EUKA|nr:hypothetical protein BLNAU_6664 [Blattamonas nauphoetae]